MILQEEVEPHQVVGFFDTENDPDRFIHSYAEHYGLDDVSHLEKYSAELSNEGKGPNLEEDSKDAGELDLEQAGFDEFRSE